MAIPATSLPAMAGLRFPAVLRAQSHRPWERLGIYTWQALSAISPDRHIPKMLYWAIAAREETGREAAGGKSVDISSSGQGLEGCYVHCQTAQAISCLCFSPFHSRKPFAKRQASTVGLAGETVHVCGSWGQSGASNIRLGPELLLMLSNTGCSNGWAGEVGWAAAWQSSLPCSLLVGGNRATGDGNRKKSKRHAIEEG